MLKKLFPKEHWALYLFMYMAFICMATLCVFMIIFIFAGDSKYLGNVMNEMMVIEVTALLMSGLIMIMNEVIKSLKNGK